MSALTRRQAVARLAAAGGALVLGGCAAGAARPDGSTLHHTFADPRGDGSLEPAAGRALLDRTELAPRAAPIAVLASVAHLSDAHVLDAQSPARVTFLDRLGPPFTSTFRPQEALTAQVLAGAVRSINAFGPQAVIQGGDLIDNAQANELDRALAVLGGRPVRPASGRGVYDGVQIAGDADPFYYRPDLDAPRHPGLLTAASRPFRAAGLRAPCHPVLGDHDLLVAGVLPPSPRTQSIAVGSRAVWELPSGLSLGRLPAEASAAPDELASPATIDPLLALVTRAPGVRVAPDVRRRELSPSEALAALRPGAAAAPRLDYHFDVGPRLRVIVLDLVRRAGGSGGLVHRGQPQWLASELAGAGERWVIVVAHQPLDTSEGGPALLALLDRFPRVVAALWGHTHRNRIRPRPSSSGGYWLISTCSLIDYPQQCRALRLVATAGGGVALQTWMLDHAPDGGLGDISRELSYLDAQGGRPAGLAGAREDQNVTLYKGAPAG